MTTIKLKNKPVARDPLRPPVRRSAPRIVPTLAEAQARRLESADMRAAERGEQRGDQRGGPRGDQRSDQRGPQRGDARGGPRGEQRFDPRDPRSAPRRADGSPGPRSSGPRSGDPRNADPRSAPRREPYEPRHQERQIRPAGGPDRYPERPDRPDYRQDRPSYGEQRRPDQRSEQPREARDGRHEERRSPPRPRLEPARPVQPNRPAPLPRPTPVTVRTSSDGEGDRLSKRLGEMGIASRREADDWIAAGWVRVDGKMAVLGQRVSRTAHIEVDPHARSQQALRVSIVINKPIGYVSGQAEDGYEPASVLIKPENRWGDDPSGLKFHPGHLRSLAPAGRLDIDSTGMLVLTQDGRIAKLLIGEDSVVEKEYLVRVEYQHEGPVPESAIALLNHGLELDGVPLRPAKVSWQNEDQLRVVLREGRKRQIRRMCEAVGLKVVGLRRVRIGRIPLGHLPVGQWRYLAPWEHFA
ncbi:MAG: pseudouridine synthase [Leptothrix ochracea]|uniref:pseudouridine synthase n=1 Tax=Leptothrix ochracea TaxID=735331 RepID=UPI0034E2CD07